MFFSCDDTARRRKRLEENDDKEEILSSWSQGAAVGSPVGRDCSYIDIVVTGFLLGKEPEGSRAVAHLDAGGNITARRFSQLSLTFSFVLPLPGAHANIPRVEGALSPGPLPFE